MSYFSGNSISSGGTSYWKNRLSYQILWLPIINDDSFLQGYLIVSHSTPVIKELFKVDNKDTRTTYMGVVLVFWLFNLNKRLTIGADRIKAESYRRKKF